MINLSSKDGLAKIVLDPNGEQSILIQTKKTPSAPFESKFYVDSAGNVRLNGNITWGTPLIQYEYSANNFSWHKLQGTGDIYRRDSTDFGRSWGVGYQFIGVNGSNGSDANVPGYIKSTYIDFTNISGTSIQSPTIEGGLFQGGEFRVIGTISSATSGISELGIYRDPDYKYGYIKYDDTGAGSSIEARERMFISTLPNRALKIESGANMSIQANKGNGTIYIDGDVIFAKKTNVVAVFG